MRESVLFLSGHTPDDPEGEKRTGNFLGMLEEKYDIDLLVGGDKPGKDLFGAIAELGRTKSYRFVFMDHTLPWKSLDDVSELVPDATIIADAYRLKAGYTNGKAGEGYKFTAPYRQLNAARTRREVRKLMGKAGLLLTASEWDALYFKALSFANAGKVQVVPACVNLKDYPFTDAPAREEAVALRWNMCTAQGKNAALLFFRTVYPAIKEKVPHCRCYLPGPDLHPEIAAAVQADPSVIVTRTDDESARSVAKVRVAIAFLRDGLGGQTEILEAWAVKTPVVMGLKGSEALQCEPGRNILLGGTAAEIGEHAIKLLKMPEMGAIIADHAYRTLLKYYEASKVKSKVLNLL